MQEGGLVCRRADHGDGQDINAALAAATDVGQSVLDPRAGESE